MNNDDLLFLPDNPEDNLESDKSETWKVLIVDDDPEVHSVTKLVLSQFSFAGKKISFLSAYSGKDVLPLFRENPDIALVFLDVVMETDDSGLRVCKEIREVLGNSFVRIVLRTGQPGLAPEREIIDHYDINDYKEKTDLTSNKLYTTTMTALRSYRDLIKIDNNRKGLEKIIESSNSIGQYKSLNRFIEGVLIQLTSILEFSHNAFYCQLPCFAACKTDSEYEILSALGKYEDYISLNLFEIEDKVVIEEIKRVIETKKNNYSDGRVIIFFTTETGASHVLYMEGNQELDIFDIELIEIFIANVAVAYDNIYLRQESEETQREIIFGLGELTEVRSNEVGRHVKRMAEYSKLLAKLLNLPEKDIDLVYIASTMHDVGKLAIPDAILNKPGKLTPDEFEIIKTHTTSGYEMLKKSSRPVMQMASIMALQHHEKFDGTGYPQGLKGEAIDITGRITAIADVFDALGTDRVYKKAWEIDEILSYMKDQSGKQFDPALIKLLLDNKDLFIEISKKFTD